MIENSKSLVIVLWALFFVITFSASLGQVARWDLLDQIAMADNFLINSNMYPEPTDELPHGVSVYFPGTALIASGLGVIGIDLYLVEFMHLIASIIVVLFLIIQVKIAQQLDNRVSLGTGSFLVIFFCVFNAWHWWSYAREFKPDTIAFLFGYVGLMIAKMLSRDTNVTSVIMGAIICSLGLIFKQQYIIFILGLTLFCIFFSNKNRIIFGAIISCSTLSALYFFYNDHSIWFWNIKVLSDDGLLSVFDILIDNYHTIVRLIAVVVLGYVILQLSQDNLITSSSLSWMEIKSHLYRHPWVWAAIPSMIAALASGAKAGGNSGNSQLGLILLAPVFVIIFRSMNKSLVIGFCFLALFSNLTFIYFGQKQYQSAIELKEFLYNNIDYNGQLILTGSNVYFATRILKDGAQKNIYNYWTIAARDGVNLDQGFAKSLLYAPEYIIAENWPTNRDILEKDGRYKVIFNNEHGFLAKK